VAKVIYGVFLYIWGFAGPTRGQHSRAVGNDVGKVGWFSIHNLQVSA